MKWERGFLPAEGSGSPKYKSSVSVQVPRCQDDEKKNMYLETMQSDGEGNDNPLQYLAWETPWTEEPGGLQSVGLQRVRHNWATKQQQLGSQQRRAWEERGFYWYCSAVPLKSIQLSRLLGISSVWVIFWGFFPPCPSCISKEKYTLKKVLVIRQWVWGSW